MSQVMIDCPKCGRPTPSWELNEETRNWMPWWPKECRDCRENDLDRTRDMREGDREQVDQEHRLWPWLDSEEDTTGV